MTSTKETRHDERKAEGDHRSRTPLEALVRASGMKRTLMVSVCGVTLQTLHVSLGGDEEPDVEELAITLGFRQREMKKAIFVGGMRQMYVTNRARSRLQTNVTNPAKNMLQTDVTYEPGR